MIVREIIKEPKLIHSFDHFNDAEDTIRWLERIDTSEAILAARRLRKAFNRYKKRLTEHRGNET